MSDVDERDLERIREIARAEFKRLGIYEKCEKAGLLRTAIESYVLGYTKGGADTLRDVELATQRTEGEA